MKKLTLLVAGFYSIIGLSQENQTTKLKALESGTIYERFSTYEKEGELKGRKSDYKFEAKTENNMHNKMSTFYFANEGTDKKDVNMGFGWLLPNHYTAPSLLYSYRHKMGYAFINDLCYGLKISDIENPEKYSLEYIFAPIREKVTAEKGEKKKLTMKEKIAAAKAKLKEASASDENTLPKSIREIEHNKIISEYLSSMKSIQTEATANFSPEIKAEIEAIEQAKKDRSAKIKATNDAYWQSPEGQEKLKRMREKSGQSSTSTKEKSGANLVNVQINPGSKAKNFLYIHWTENGSKKSKTLSSRSTSSIGKVPAGTKLYYSIDDKNGSQTYFYQVPSGKSSVSVAVQ